MKKRKELDALLMNGKKSRPKRTKDGHELLQNMDSDTNSSDIDEFIMQPRKQTFIRRKFGLCSICIRLFFFMLVVACIAISCGVMWMHFELKNDLDELRGQLEAVRLSADKSSIPDEAIESLQDRIKVLPDLITNYGYMNATLNTFNSSIRSFRLDLKVVKDLTKTTHDLEKSLSRTTEELSKLQSKVSDLEKTVKELSSVTPPPPPRITTVKPEQLQTPLPVNNVDTTGVVLELQKSIETLDHSLKDLNSTVVRLTSEVSAVKAQAMPTNAGTSQQQYESVLSQLRHNVTYLMRIVVADSSAVPSSAGPYIDVESTVPIDITTDWKQHMIDRINVLEIEVKNLNPEDLNNNLLNNDTARGLQNILENTYKDFHDEISDSIQLLQSHEAEINKTLLNGTMFMTELATRVDYLELKVDNITAHISEPNEAAVYTKKAPSVIPILTNPPPVRIVKEEGATPETFGDTEFETAGNIDTTIIPDSMLLTQLSSLTDNNISSLATKMERSLIITETEFLTDLDQSDSNAITFDDGTLGEVTTTLKTLSQTPLHIIIPGIITITDVNNNFNRWDKITKDGKLTYEEFKKIPNFHRTTAPSEGRFLAYDKNRDTFLSKSELIAALHL